MFHNYLIGLAMANLVPLGSHIVVEPQVQENRSAAGILLPEKDEKPQRGKVIAVGQGEKQEDGSRTPMDIAVGDTIVFKKYSPDEFEMDGKKVLIMRESDVLAKLA